MTTAQFLTEPDAVKVIGDSTFFQWSFSVTLFFYL